MPLCRRSASSCGGRPRNATNDSRAGRRAPAREHLVAEARSDLGRKHAPLLEQAVGVRGKHLGPLVAVVAGGVAAGEDMAECVHEAVVVGRGTTAISRRTASSTACGLAYAPPPGAYALCSSMSNSANSSCRTIAMPLWKLRAASISLEQRARQRFAGVDVRASSTTSTSHSQQKFSMNWLGSSTASHSTPWMSGHAGHVDARQQLVQPMAELVEQRDHLVVGERRGPVAAPAPGNCR